MLDHQENFELEKEYDEVWNSIKFKRIDEISQLTMEVNAILDGHINDDVPFNSDCHKIQKIFTQMKQRAGHYFSRSAQDIIKTANPRYENVFERRECVRDLKYIGTDEPEESFEKGKVYTSTHFNGATYSFNINGQEKVIGSSYFERVS